MPPDSNRFLPLVGAFRQACIIPSGSSSPSNQGGASETSAVVPDEGAQDAHQVIVWSQVHACLPHPPPEDSALVPVPVWSPATTNHPLKPEMHVTRHGRVFCALSFLQ